MVSTKQLIHQLSKNTIYLSVISSIGLMLSFYTLYIEVLHENDKTYNAFCDINSYISCSKVFLSEYGTGFGFIPQPFKFPNPVYGLLFYLIQLVIANVANNSLFLTKVYIFNAILSNIGSIYLGYILAFILKNLCIVCVMIYGVNLIMLLVAIYRYKLITSYKRYKKD